MVDTHPFSAHYTLIDGATVKTWDQEEAHMDIDLYDFLSFEFGEPVVGFVGGGHFSFRPSTDVFHNQCAVPQDVAGRRADDSALLIQRGIERDLF